MGGWLRRPLGRVVEDGEFGKWVPIDRASTSADTPSNNGDTEQRNGSSSILRDTTNGVPTYGHEPITSTEEFLKMYRDKMEKKLAVIDEQLEEMDDKQH